MIRLKLCVQILLYTDNLVCKNRADRMTRSLAIHHFRISEQTCCFSLVSNPFGPQLCRPNSCITESISPQFRLNRPTRSLAMSNSNFPLTDFAKNAQSNSSSLSSPLQLNADFHWVADTSATSHMTPHHH